MIHSIHYHIPGSYQVCNIYKPPLNTIHQLITKVILYELIKYGYLTYQHSRIMIALLGIRY